MVSPSQAKGDRYEREVRTYLRDRGVPLIRQHDGGTLDTGDFIIGPFLVEAKSYKDTTRALALGIAEASRAVLASPGYIPAALVKRHGFRIGASYLTIQLSDLPSLLALLDR